MQREKVDICLADQTFHCFSATVASSQVCLSKVWIYLLECMKRQITVRFRNALSELTTSGRLECNNCGKNLQ